jgi:predicted TIM-barrel fold metal-dependent hydrolase
MSPDALDLDRRLIQHLAGNQDRLVIDADAHATDVGALSGALRWRFESAPGYYHGRPVSAPDLILEMDQAAVDMALIWQNPAATSYTRDADRNAESLLAANRYVLDAALRYPLRFIPAGWTDPKACGLANALRIVETCVREFGFPIVKLNPAQNSYPIDSPAVLEIVTRILELGALPAFHFGADTPYTPAEGLRRVAMWNPDHPVLAVHMGGGGASYEAAEDLYLQARRLGLEQPNIRFALSAKRDAHIESDLIAYQLAGPPFSGNLFCASDAPYGRIAWNFGGYRWMFQGLLDGARHPDPRLRANPSLFTPQAVQGYLGGNFARFAAAALRRLLQIQAS